MKTVGLVGGIGPESTIEYYRFLVAAYRERVPDGSYPKILINSIDMTKMLGLIGAGQLDAVTEYLSAEIAWLAQGGADFAALASNTPHVVFDALAREAPIPLISIVEAACGEALRLGYKKVGLFGTRFTMQGPFYPAVFARHGVAVVLPAPEEQTFVHDKYMGELLKGVFLPETRDALLRIARRMRDEQQIEALVLGGTELPLILRDAPDPGIPFLDTTRIHVARILDAMMS